MVDKIKEWDTAVVVIIMIWAVSYLAWNDSYTEPVALFFSSLAGYLLGAKSK